VSKSEKDSKARAPEADKPYRSFPSEPIPLPPDIQLALDRARDISDRIRKRKTKEREKAALIERAQLRRDGGEQALFDDDDLCQKREARIVAMECFTFVTTNSEALQ